MLPLPGPQSRWARRDIGCCSSILSNWRLIFWGVVCLFVLNFFFSAITEDQRGRTCEEKGLIPVSVHVDVLSEEERIDLESLSFFSYKFLCLNH